MTIITECGGDCAHMSEKDKYHCTDYPLIFNILILFNKHDNRINSNSGSNSNNNNSNSSNSNKV